jgi:teichuronic acid exporter
MSLRKKALNGFFWTLGQQFSVQIINFAVQIILARILLPEAFGLIAMIQIFVSIGQTLMDSGMTSSLIRMQNPDQRDYSTVFFINILFSFILYLILFFCAPVISSFFSQPLLKPIIRVYTLTFIIQALVTVQTTRLTKEMNFKLQMLMQLPSTIIGGIVGITMAYHGYGVWSLIGLTLVTTFVFMVQHWFRTDWKPSFIIDTKKLKYHFSFGYKLTLSGLLTSIYTNSYTLIIGKFFAPAQLGFYNQANTLRMFPVNNITIALSKVTYPMFSAIQDDNEKFKSVFKAITKQVFFIITPVMLFLVTIAEPLFRFGLTAKWLPAVPYFQILCLSAIVYPQSMYNLNIITAKGRSDMHLKMEVIKKTLSVAFLLLVIPYGIWGIIYAQSLSMLLHAYVNAIYSGKMINYPLSEQLKDIFPVFLVALSTFLVHRITDIIWMKYFHPGDLLRIIIGFLIFTLTYVVISYSFKLSAFIELNRMLFNKGKLKEPEIVEQG